MTTPRFESFEEFWPYYVLEHSDKRTRQFHFAGTAAALGVTAYGLLSGRYRALLLAPLCGYGGAWFSHFFIEKNKPATFDYPAWSLRGDFVMFAKMLMGTMDEEVARCAREAAQAADDGAADSAAADSAAADVDPFEATPDAPPVNPSVAAVNAPPLR